MDNHTRNRYQQLQNFIDSTYLLAKHSEQKIELLFIEWNPPIGKRRVHDAFRFRKSEYLNYRFITIPPKIHDSFDQKYGPLSVSEGKNLGIHFARGQYVVFVNQDSIWSHNFINAIKSKTFEKDTIYLQAQHTHETRDNLPSTIIDLGAFPDDATLHNACKLRDQDWGNYQLFDPNKLEKHWNDKDQVDDFALAHRDTWKDCIGNWASRQVARALTEFILTVTSTFNKKLVYSKDMLTCHQKHVNESGNMLKNNTNNKDNLTKDALRNQTAGMSKGDKWSLHPIEDWKKELECLELGINSG
ncbi:hypothetical protein G6F37_010357 [Rhizopus arrhizus]|nr:hypothetical protein G6F38_008754 [Rhizopus arrhizus]KAG1153437.1 hypothetical protein G6F37_010357 [Rhizopus arrhizus]